MQQSALLLNHADLAPQAVLGDVRHALPVNHNLPGLNVIKPQQQFQQCRLSRPRAPNQTDFFTGTDGERHITKPTTLTAIMMRQALHFDLTLSDGQRLRP